MTRFKHLNTEPFQYINVNPYKLLTSEDCVVRAIAFALNMEWDDVLICLCNTATINGYMPTQGVVYEKFIKERGFNTVYWANDTSTVQAFADYYPTDTLLLLMEIEGTCHLTCIKNGILYDTTNYLAEEVINAWILKKE